MARAQLCLLGRAHFKRDQQRIEITSAKAIATLAFLALQRTPVIRDRLLTLLWAESAEEAARKNLRNTLWTIRKAIGEDVVITEGNRIRLAPTVEVDVLEFEQLVARLPDATTDPLLDRYEAQLLEGLVLTEAPDFELWLTQERDRLSTLFSTAMARLVDQRRLQGDWKAVRTLSRRALAHDNLQEPMYRALMQSLAHLGDRSEALHQYELLKLTLNRELGVEPLTETQALYQAILGGGVGVQSLVPTSIRPERRPSVLKNESNSAFVGRLSELAELNAALETSKQGHAQIVLLRGDLGIGKSRLWREWSESLPAELLSMETRCLESTQALPFSPLSALFSSRMCSQRLFDPETPLAHVWLVEIARLFPELRMRFPDLPSIPVLPPEEERHRILEAFTQCVIALNANPLILFFDDLHWADRATLDWIDYLIHRLRETSLLIVGAYRPNDASSALSHYIAGWSREGLARRLNVSALTVEESRALLKSRGDDPAKIHHIQTQSAGNPYFMLELSQAVPGNVPSTLRELVMARLDRLPESARQVLQAAAVLEPDFDFAVLTRVSGRSEDETLDALDTLLTGETLSERDGRYLFIHPLVATIVRENMSAARRGVLHQRAALAREAEFATRLPVVAGQLATHFEQAGDRQKASIYADMAAARALSLAAPAEAEAFIRQAIRLEPTPARYNILGRTIQFYGEASRTREIYSQALALALATGDQQAAAEAMLNMAETYIPAGQHDEIIQWVNRALPLTSEEANPEAHAQAHFLMGVGKLADNQGVAAAEAELLQSKQLTDTHHLKSIAVRARFELGNVLAERGDLFGAIDAYCESVALAQAIGERNQEALGYNNAAYHAMLTGDLARARTFSEAGLQVAELLGLRIPLQYLYSTRGEIAMAEQDWDEAEAWFNRAIAETNHTGHLRQQANIEANLALVAQHRGDLDNALLQLELAKQKADGVASPHLHIQIELWLTELHLQRGERLAAAEALSAAEARLQGSGRDRLIQWAARLRQQLGNQQLRSGD